MSTTQVTSFPGVAAVTLRCWCSLQMAIPETLHGYYIRKNENEPGSFALRCPMGHTFIPAGKSRADRLQDELVRERHRTEQAQASAEYHRNESARQLRRARARQGVITRLKRRMQKGYCPCCSAQFKDLARHLKQRHPDWSPEKHAEAIEAKGK